MAPRAAGRQGRLTGWRAAAGLLAAVGLVGAATPLASTDLKLAGNLTGNNGVPLTGSVDLSLVLTGVTPTCDAGVVTVTLGPEGYFELPLTGCTAALKSGTGVGATLTVNGVAYAQQPLLVPYALQANHSVQADSAQRIDKSQADADAGSIQSVLRGKASGMAYATKTDGGFTSYSVRGTFCGTAQVNSAGTMSVGVYHGYQASMLICESACSSINAHMCASDDVLRSQALGVAVPDGFYSTGVVWTDGVHGLIADCGGWTDVSSFGPYWSATTGPTAFNCGVPAAVLCCK
jgi:hypothetical protein